MEQVLLLVAETRIGENVYRSYINGELTKHIECDSMAEALKKKWELVSVCKPDNGDFHFYFRRNTDSIKYCLYYIGNGYVSKDSYGFIFYCKELVESDFFDSFEEAFAALQIMFPEYQISKGDFEIREVLYPVDKIVSKSKV